jgi:hypothetical protein
MIMKLKKSPGPKKGLLEPLEGEMKANDEIIVVFSFQVYLSLSALGGLAVKGAKPPR